MSLEQSRLVYVFFSYARQDKMLRDKLEDHLSNLKYRGLISTWHDREITAGMEWAHQIDIHLDTAHLILLLISSNFMASEYCYSIEMKRAIERHEEREARVIPILLRPVLFTDAPFAKLQFLPSNRKPVVEWHNRDRAFVDIALGIERVVREFHASIPQTPATTGIDHSVTLHSQRRPALIQRSVLSCGSVLGMAAVGVVGLFVALIIHLSLAYAILLVGAIIVGLILLDGIYAVVNWMIEQRVGEERQRKPERTYYEKALAAYDQALHHNTSDATAHRGRGNALEALGRYNEALEAFEKAVNLEPTPTAFSGKGRIFLKLKRYDESLAAYERALQLDPTDALAYVEMGETFEQLGRSEEAAQMREKANQLGYEE